MVVIRGTKKFLDRVGRPVPNLRLSNTALGDWYAAHLPWRPQVALFINAPTLLPVLVPFAPAAAVTRCFTESLPRILYLHGVDDDFIANEAAAMRESQLAKTASRSLTGMLTEFTYLANAWRADVDDLDLISLRLGDVPSGPLYKTHVTPHAALKAAVAEWHSTY